MCFDPSCFGVLTRAHLARLGMDTYRCRRAIEQGRLRRERPGVFVVGAEPSEPVERWRQRCAVALVAAGPDATLSRSAAGALWGFDGVGIGTSIPVNVPLRSGVRRQGVHRRRAIGEPVCIDGLPATSAEQTLLELAGSLTAQRVTLPGGDLGQWLSGTDRVELALESALRRGVASEGGLLALAAQLPNRTQGLAVLDEALQRRPPGQPPTESYLETRCVQVLRNAGLPTGERQVQIEDDRGRFVGRVDLRVAAKVVVEVDGRAHHGEDRYRHDRRRWTRLSALGYGVAVFTWEDVELDPAFVVAEVRDLLARY